MNRLAIIENGSSPSNEVAIVESKKDEEQPEKGLLDGFLLLEACNVELPDHATRVVLNDRKLTRVVEEDLLYYNRLSYADFGENRLRLEQLKNLKGLEELRLQCNEIEMIPMFSAYRPFPLLVVLDLSYNCLTPESVANLARLSRLRELDLTCNELGSIPDAMDEFHNLEVLLVGQNRLRSENCISALSLAPKLRELDASDNEFERIPEDVEFPCLEWLNLANNKIRRQIDVEPLLGAPELTQVLLYGNPLSKHKAQKPSRRKGRGDRNRMSGSTRTESPPKSGSSALQTEETLGPALSMQVQPWSEREVINVVTDAPKAKKLGKGKNTRGMYSHFQIAKVEELQIRKPSEWKAMGNEILFKSLTPDVAEEENETQRLSIADREEEKQNHDEGKEALDEEELQHRKHDGKSIFLTEPTLFDDPNEGDVSSNQLTSTMALKQQLAQYASLEEKTADHHHKLKKANPAKLRNAVSALRYALKHPLTSHDLIESDEGPSSMFGNTKTITCFPHFEQKTLASKLKEKPRIPFEPIKKKMMSPKSMSRQFKQLENGPSSNNKPRAEKNAMLDSIETVLDRMEFNRDIGNQIHELHSPNYRDETDRAVDGLIGLVNNVMENFER